MTDLTPWKIRTVLDRLDHARAIYRWNGRTPVVLTDASDLLQVRGVLLAMIDRLTHDAETIARLEAVIMDTKETNARLEAVITDTTIRLDSALAELADLVERQQRSWLTRALPGAGSLGESVG
jgi:transposase